MCKANTLPDTGYYNLSWIELVTKVLATHSEMLLNYEEEGKSLSPVLRGIGSLGATANSCEMRLIL